MSIVVSTSKRSKQIETVESWPAAMRDKTAAKYLDISRSKLWQLAATDELHPVKLPGRQTRFLRSDLDAFLERAGEGAGK